MVFQSRRDGNRRRRHWTHGRHWTNHRKDQPLCLYHRPSSHHDQQAPRYQLETGIRSYHKHQHSSHSSRVSRICRYLNKLHCNNNNILLSRKCNIRTTRGNSPQTPGADSRWLSNLPSILPTDNNTPSSSNSSSSSFCRHSRPETHSSVLRDHKCSLRATLGRSQLHHNHSRLQSRKPAIPLACHGHNSRKHRLNRLPCSNSQWCNPHQQSMDSRMTSSAHHSKRRRSSHSRAICLKLI